jgi:hypothetical protein
MNKKPWLAALLNFFFMGLGYIYNMKRVGLGIGFTIGAIVLTYVELQLQTSNPTLHKIMFGAVFLINTCFAVDGYNEAKKISEG